MVGDIGDVEVPLVGIESEAVGLGEPGLRGRPAIARLSRVSEKFKASTRRTPRTRKGRDGENAFAPLRILCALRVGALFLLRLRATVL